MSTSATSRCATWAARGWACSTTPPSPATAGRLRVGTNQIGRYAIHFHHNFGPAIAPANGYQYTLIGNAVRGAAKWGITIHNTHFGLVQDNVVYETRGAAIVTEDGTESFNVFDHNFSVRTEGAGDNAPPRGGYGGGGPDPGGDGSSFWFSGPNNYVRNNVAASAEMSGFSLAGGAGVVRIPAAKGSDTTRLSDTKPLDIRTAATLEFANNEAYGAMQVGLECSWSAVVSKFVVWNASRYGMIGNPAETLEIDRFVARGQPAHLADTGENPTGIWLGDYAGKQIVVRGADIEGWRTGVASPFVRHAGQPINGRGSVLIEGSRFKNYFGVVVGTGYTDPSSTQPPSKRAVVRASTFEVLPDVPLDAANPPVAISMNYLMAPGDTAARAPIFVYDFNNQPGDTFKVYYSLDAPPQVAPCHESRGGIGGWVCR